MKKQLTDKEMLFCTYFARDGDARGCAARAGYAKLAASADGVQVSDGGREYLVVEVDTDTMTVTFLM